MARHNAGNAFREPILDDRRTFSQGLTGLASYKLLGESTHCCVFVTCFSIYLYHALVRSLTFSNHARDSAFPFWA